MSSSCVWFLGPWGQTLSFIGLSFWLDVCWLGLNFPSLAILCVFFFCFSFHSIFIKVAHIAHLPRPFHRPFQMALRLRFGFCFFQVSLRQSFFSHDSFLLALKKKKKEVRDKDADITRFAFSIFHFPFPLYNFASISAGFSVLIISFRLKGSWMWQGECLMWLMSVLAEWHFQPGCAS